MRAILLIISLLLCSIAHAVESSPPSPATPGSWQVGFRVVEQSDASRSDNGEHAARPVQTLIWYPATQRDKALRYEDYLELGVAENDFSRTPAERRTRTDASLRAYTVLGTTAGDMARWRDAPVAASRDASPASGRFPVVIYVASDSSPAFENDWLCEYLASHGYVVIASPSHGIDGGYMTDGRLPHDLASTRAQAADIGFLIGYAGSLPFADTTKLAVVGYSWGGMSGAFAAAADKRIRAIVEWDGSLRYFPRLLRAAPDIVAEDFTTPMLFIADREDPIVPARDAWPQSFVAHISHADLTLIGMKRLFHQDLSAQSLRLGSMAVHTDTTLAQRLESYAWMERYTLAFLDERLKHDDTARAFLDATSLQNHVPPGTLTVMRRHATSSSGNRADFAARLDATNDDPMNVYRPYARQHPGFQLANDTLSQWISQLMATGDMAKASRVALLWTEVLPRSSEAWSSRATMEDMQDMSEQAIRDYRRALRLDRGNILAKRRLAAITAAPGH